jgi:hypothetical protein
MSMFSKLIHVALLVLVVAFATTAGAQIPIQYQGSLIIDAFANDTTDQGNYPFSTNVFLGHPFGTSCNTMYGPNTTMACWGVDPSAQDGSPLTGSGTLSVAAIGPGAPFALPQSALKRKLGTPATSFEHLASSTTRPIHCTASGAGAGCGTPGGSFSYYHPYIYSFTYADLKNAAGNFFGGGGPGNFTFNYSIGSPPKKQAQLVVNQGGNRFGGTMRLLGFFYSQGAFYVSAGNQVGSSHWLFERVGGGGMYAGTVLTAPNTATTTFTAKHTVLKTTNSSTAKASYVGWTTGSVTVTATKRGPFPSVMRRAGYDNRTVTKGLGNIQLVSPMLTHWFGVSEDWETTAVGMMKISFVPEPAGALMLVAGASLIGILYRKNRNSD